jgi:hypothetical protein
MADYLPAAGMVLFNLKLTFYRDYAFVLYIEIGSYHNLSRTGSYLSCSGNDEVAYHIHHTMTAFGSDHSHPGYHNHMNQIQIQACQCSQCK